jgi:hypothetical protein
MVVFGDDFLAGFAFVMFAFEFAFRLELFVDFLCVNFESFYQLGRLGRVGLDHIRGKWERGVLLFVF